MRRWTINEMNGMDDLTFAIAILNERGNGLNYYSPLAQKIASAKRTLELLRETQQTPDGMLCCGQRTDGKGWAYGYFVMDERPVIVESLACEIGADGKACLPNVFPVKPETVQLFKRKKVGENGEPVDIPAIKERKIVQIYASEVMGMIADLGNGETTANGDRTSRYITIAKGVGEKTGLKVNAALVENKANLAEDCWFYELHVINDVDMEDCQSFYTKSLDSGELEEMMGDILKKLDAAMM